MPWNNNLQGTHLDIAAYPGTPLRVIAGPGTGKTFALMRRITRLLEEGVPPNQILAVTFTRTAAADLVDQIAALGVPGAADVAAKTLHSLSFGLLSRTSVFQTLGRVARPLMDCERKTLVCDLQDQFGGKKAVNKLIEAFDAYWAKLQHHDPGWPIEPVEQQFDHSLREWLTFHRAMLIGEVVPLAYDFVSQNPAHPDIPHYTHIVVDEYQDLNRADQALIDALATHASITVVGDEDQSIYSFRFANPEGIVHFPQTHAHTHDELLNVCRRCPQRVVSMANSLIGHNQRLAPKVLAPFAGNEQGTIYIVQHNSVVEEIETLSAYVDHYLGNNPTVPAGGVLVLANRHVIGNGIRDRLNELAALHHRTWDAKSFYFEDAVKPTDAAEAFTLLALLVDPDDRPALRFWLGAGSPDCRKRPYARLRTYCQQNDVSPRAALELLANGQIQIPYSTPLLNRFTELQQRLVALSTLDIATLIDALFPANITSLAPLRQIALTVSANVHTPQELLAEIRSDITQPELPGTQGTSVRIMSLHKSKGLTAKLVIIAGCVNGIIPSIDLSEPLNEQNRQRQEQRRLFFVGVTRSTETLVLSSAVRMPQGEAMQMGVRFTHTSNGLAILQASSFLAELGPNAPTAIRGMNWRTQLHF
jgi:superfamily I DNA/RNA helicase